MTKISVKKTEQHIYIPNLKNDLTGDSGWRVFWTFDYEKNVKDYKVGMEIKMDDATITKKDGTSVNDYTKVEAVFSIERNFSYWHDYLNLVSISSERTCPPLRDATTDRLVEIPIEGLNRSFFFHASIFGVVVVMVLSFFIGGKKKQ